MDSVVNRRLKERRARPFQTAHPQPGSTAIEPGDTPNAAQLIADTPQDLVTTFLPATWHPRHEQEADESRTMRGFYNPFLSPPATSTDATCQRGPFGAAPPAPRGFFNPALAPSGTASGNPWARGAALSVPRVFAEPEANLTTHLSAFTPARQSIGEPTLVSPHSDALRTHDEVPFVPAPAPVSSSAPGMYAPASRRAVRGQTGKPLPELLQHTTLWQHGGETEALKGRTPHTDPRPHDHLLGDTPFSVLVLDFETTGFSAAREQIVEVGAVELRWTGRRDQGDGSPPGEWRFGTRSFHRFVDPKKTDSVWWRCRQQCDVSSEHNQVRGDDGSLMSIAESVHGLSASFLNENGVSWGDAAAGLAAFCKSLSLHAGVWNTDNDEDDDVASLLEIDTATPASPRSAVTTATTLHMPPFMAHRAVFDTAFLETHMARAGYRVVWHTEAPVTCTMKLCKQLYPQQPASLDAACQFFAIEERLERAARHGALLDATLCAHLFLRLERRVRDQLGDVSRSTDRA